MRRWPQIPSSPCVPPVRVARRFSPLSSNLCEVDDIEERVEGVGVVSACQHHATIAHPHAGKTMIDYPCKQALEFLKIDYESVLVKEDNVLGRNGVDDVRNGPQAPTSMAPINDQHRSVLWNE